jgi:hypothetical protein
MFGRDAGDEAGGVQSDAEGKVKYAAVGKLNKFVSDVGHLPDTERGTGRRPGCGKDDDFTVGLEIGECERIHICPLLLSQLEDRNATNKNDWRSEDWQRIEQRPAKIEELPAA